MHGRSLFRLTVPILLLQITVIVSPVWGSPDEEFALKPVPQDKVRLLPGLFQQRTEINRNYLMSLTNEALLQNFYMEAGLWNPRLRNTSMGSSSWGEDIHWGWESPTCQLRGHFLGHWLSAAARLHYSTGDQQLKAKADYIVAELARCQEVNGGGWVGSIPEKYLDWISQGKRVWAPHYTLHKTLMGLLDMNIYAGNQQALEILNGFAGWFTRWTSQFSRSQMDDILDVETGGMLESWADLYAITRRPEHLELIRKYDRPRLFERLLANEDPLTNRHANTTIPEMHGAARAYEVTGEARWRRIAESYWDSAVTNRGHFCTGGQTSGEVWTPPHAFSSRLSDKTQEHCTVYNMIRLADYLFRWTGDVKYADYIERNIYNGILAQQHPQTGMVAYFLPLEAGGKKLWSSPTNDFWCCVGSLVQAHTLHNRYIYYTSDQGVTVSQYIPSEASFQIDGTEVRLTQRFDDEQSYFTVVSDDPFHRPNRWVLNFSVAAENPVEFGISLRLPWWLAGEAELYVNEEKQDLAQTPSSFQEIRRTWQQDQIRLILPKKLWTEPVPDDPELVAFMDGPLVLAGLCEEERALVGDPKDPASILVPDNEREWSRWLPGYRTRSQQRGLTFRPLYTIVDEPYTVYFPVTPAAE